MNALRSIASRFKGLGLSGVSIFLGSNIQGYIVGRLSHILVVVLQSRFRTMLLEFHNLKVFWGKNDSHTQALTKPFVAFI